MPDSTGSSWPAPELAECDHHTVKKCVQERDAGKSSSTRSQRPKATDAFPMKVDSSIEPYAGLAAANSARPPRSSAAVTAWPDMRGTHLDATSWVRTPSPKSTVLVLHGKRSPSSVNFPCGRQQPRPAVTVRRRDATCLSGGTYSTFTWSRTATVQSPSSAEKVSSNASVNEPFSSSVPEYTPGWPPIPPKSKVKSA